MEMIMVEAKDGFHMTPRKLRSTAERLTSIYGKPTVFLFDNLSYVERNRLIDQNVYFIVSCKYIFLPNLVIAVRDTEPVKATKMTPAAQYVLLAFLQDQIRNNITARELTDTIPYKYVTITLAFRLLESLHLCWIETGEDSFKRIVFDEDKATLYNLAKPYFINPVRERHFCDSVHTAASHKQAGISALAHYSALNLDEIQTIALTAEQWRDRESADFENLNPFDGDYCIEVWHYQPIPTDEEHHSLSAIILDDDFYNFTVQQAVDEDGLMVANNLALIMLKMNAYLNLLAEKKTGHHVDSDDISKHRSDVLKLVAAGIYPEPVKVKSKFMSVLNDFTSEVQLHKQSLKDALGVPANQIDAFLNVLRDEIFVEE